MSPLTLLNEYLARLESRFRFMTLVRGAAVVAAAALAATMVLVLASNWLAFSERSVTGSRIALFLTLAFAVAFGIVAPLLRLSRRNAARAAEKRIPDFEQRLVTIAEREDDPAQQPFLELLAADTLPLLEQAEPRRVIGTPVLAGFLSGAAVGVGVLLWLILGASGFLGYGSRLLWAGPPKDNSAAPAFYDIVVTPGDKTVRRGASQNVAAHLVGFESANVRLFARYRDSAKWEEAPMVPQAGSSDYEFLFAGLPETVEYYATAGRLRSKTYTLSVVDVPNVKRMRVTYRYPNWTGLAPETEDPGGDLRAVEGTEAELAIETDRPLSSGELVMEDGSTLRLSKGEGNWVTARVPIEMDSSYFVAAREQGEQVRLTDDYFIEVRRDQEPVVRITRPGRDAKVTPIEEVVIAVDGADDYGLQDLKLHYSVNAGPEKTVSLLKQKNTRDGEGNVLLALEDYKLVPGDLISVYATAADARQTARTDMFFIETQPFEREYSQSQQMGGGGGGGGGGEQDGEREGMISQRQKEIISATWNQLRSTSKDKNAAAENAQFLSETQAKLRDQAQSLSARMGRRELSQQNQEFQDFGNQMQEAAKDMSVASERLKSMKWREAMEPEQQALQHLLRAEATYRQIEVAFGNQGGRQGGGGGGGGGMQRDLENLFDLELDTERNQYETGQQAQAGASQRAREIDEALQRLEQLARRQQELAARDRQPQQSFQQRWQQELLRREAEQLQQRMEQLSRNNQQGQGTGQGGRSAADARLDQALGRLSQATEDMRRAGNNQGQADSRRAAERLREAQDLMRGVRGDQANQQLDDLAQRSERLAGQQQDFQNRMRQLMGAQPDASAYVRPDTGAKLDQARKLAEERDQMVEELGRIQRQMQQASRDLAGSQRNAASQVRNALGDLQQNEVETRMRYNNDLLRRGYGTYAVPREAPISAGLNELRDQLREARGALDRQSPERGNQEQALARLEQLRNRLQEMTGRSGQQPGQQGQQGRAGQQQNQGGRPNDQGQSGGQGRGQAPGQAQGQPQDRGQGQGGRGGGGGGGRDGQPQNADAFGAMSGFRQGGGTSGFDRSAINRGDLRFGQLPSEIRTPSDAELARFYQESMRDLSALRDSLPATGGGTRDIQDLLEEMKRLDPSRFPGNPELLERIRAQILPALEQMEVQLRRQTGEDGGQVRNSASEPVPPGYSGAVAEYFRRLGKSKQ